MEQIKPIKMTSMQISVYAVNCTNEDKYIEEVAELIDRYADTKNCNLHNKIMVQWEKDFGSIHNEQNMDAYTVSGFVRNILGTDRQT